MFLRSRSAVSLSLFQDNSPTNPTESKTESVTQRSPMKSSAPSNHISGSTTNFKLLKYIVGISLVVCIFLYFTMMQSIDDPDRHRTVRGRPQQRMLTVVMNTFKRHDLMVGEFLASCFINVKL